MRQVLSNTFQSKQQIAQSHSPSMRTETETATIGAISSIHDNRVGMDFEIFFSKAGSFLLMGSISILTLPVVFILILCIGSLALANKDAPRAKFNFVNTVLYFLRLIEWIRSF